MPQKKAGIARRRKNYMDKRLSGIHGQIKSGRKKKTVRKKK